MGIYIKGMEMPKEFGRCMVIFPDGRVTTEFGSQVIARAIPVLPHGRLIDADALRSKFREPNKENGGWRNPDEALVHKMDVWAAIDAVPTIIEAEEG